LVGEGVGFCDWRAEGVEFRGWMKVAGGVVCHEGKGRCGEEEEVEAQEVGNPGAGGGGGWWGRVRGEFEKGGGKDLEAGGGWAGDGG
jgi:hypothetical protein